MKFTLLLIPLIFLSSCTIDWNNEKDAKIAELEKEVQELKQKNDDDLFKKKQECLEIYKKFDSTNALGRKDLFYSEGDSTCIMVGDYWHKEERTFLIIDILAQKKLYGFSVDKDWNILGRTNLSGTLEELKCDFNKKLYLFGRSTYFDNTCI